jgi:CRP-like cAMP-binding protein
MQFEASLMRSDGPAPHPLAELLACPAAVGSLLNVSAQTIEFDAGDTVFRQGGKCRGLYVIVSGQLMRKTERHDTRLMLGTARAGNLVELAAALGDSNHTYTLVGQTPGSLLLLPIDALEQAFQAYPPLRMHLLEELAREVSRAYSACRASRSAGLRRRTAGVAPA